jgi:type III restriction enzyme
VKFLEEINQRIEPDKVKYDVVTAFGKLMEIMGRGEDKIKNNHNHRRLYTIP